MKYEKKSKEELKNEVKKLSEELEKKLESLFSSDEYIEFLSVMAKRPTYSMHNNLLIYMQKPDALFLAGYKTFLNTYGHQVQQGEKGIRIFAPVLYKKKKKDQDLSTDILPDTKEDNEETCVAFRIVRIFDISQTKPVTIQQNGVETISPKAQKLFRSLQYITLSDICTEETELVKTLFDAIFQVIPIPVKQTELSKNLGGYFSFKNKDDLHIVLNSTFNSAKLLQTMIHEWAHYELHNPYSVSNELTKNASKYDKEIQAESISYVVLKHFGFDCSSEALKYVAAWSSKKNTDDLKKSLLIIQKTSAFMINSISAVLEKKPEIFEHEIHSA